MELGMIGLGKMGGFMVERLVRGGHKVIGFDRDATAVQRVTEKGAGGVDSLEKLLGTLKAPRAVWLMVPAGAPVDQTIDLLTPHLSPGDTIIDGGNSYYRDSMRRAAALKEKKFNFVDCGTSGGVWGLAEGYSMMIGGDSDVVDRLSPIFKTLAPGPDKGWGRVGPAGAGHFVKMVHNGIEYGIMQAYAEGLDLFRHKKEFGLDLLQIAKIWQYGSVVRSWLLDLTVDALSKNPGLEGIGAYVTDSGEGRWTAVEGIELGVPLPTLNGALDARFRSQDPEPFANKILAMMRHEFGGHAVKTAAKD
ncbi:MAG TPA: decarboxylating 6-phosphogluconate dehydrogenase [Candidatus Acidoferrales bacterium]|jgi:6-phosphogluconate dehydrogenase|nr:decarboxylating 6-phosphogluconate dehydrogenase [Candidatus Acidoferrales bacterium]